MKTVPLRMLVRDPRKVKRMTRSGAPVLVTDNGESLWILRSVAVSPPSEDEARRRAAIDEILDETLREKPSKTSAVRLLEESRR